MADHEPSNHPLPAVQAKMDQWIAKGAECYQKFTCSQCGERLTMDVPNVLYTEGTCDKCGGLTNIEQDGCNFMLVWTRGGGGTGAAV